MYLHIGGDYTVRKKEIVCIMDIENTSISKYTKNFLKKAEKEGKIINVSKEDLPKSFIVTNSKFGERIYISPISPQTLGKRTGGKINA